MTTAVAATKKETIQVGPLKVQILRGGKGSPLLVLHREFGSPGWIQCLEDLAARHTIYLPSHPGFDSSDLPQWARSVRDLASLHLWLLDELKLSGIDVLGLGFGGWIAAEMATMNHKVFRKMALAAPMGVQPKEGEIYDQFLVGPLEYIQACFHDKTKCNQQWGSQPTVDQLEIWEINREMTTRVAWKPYMFDQSLPHLLPGVKTPTLLVWGKEDKIVPASCGKQYQQLLPNARLETIAAAGHCVEYEKPKELAKLVGDFLA